MTPYHPLPQVLLINNPLFVAESYFLSLDSYFKKINESITRYSNLQGALFHILKEQIKITDLPATDSSVLEQALFFNKNPHKITEDYLENFLFHTPNGQYRELSKSVGTLEKTLTEVYLERNSKLPENLQILHSNKRLNSTYSSFFEDIDNSIINTGITISEIEHLNLKFFDDEYSDLRQYLIFRLNTKLIPVYKDLRQKGYLHYDLVI